MELSEKDIDRLNSAIVVLKTALAELEEIKAKIELPEPVRKRRNLKQERIEKYRQRFESGQMRRHRK